MLRILSRFLGIWLLAGALVAAVVDGARSIASSSVVLTPAGETWATFAAWAGIAREPGEAAGLPWPLDVALAWIAAAPTVAVLAALSFLLLSAGRRRRERAFGREFAT
jgi:hypothetical protein